ncbi:MAG TPA: adenylate/guanylate cyclase domain-containing protein, partial [Chloroflexota bacterium]
AYTPFYRALTVGVAATLVAVLVLQGLPFIGRAELSTYDYQFTLRGTTSIPSNIVVVGLDSPTITDLQGGRYPIARRWIGQAVNFLHRAHAQAIGLDFLYQAPSGFGLKDDAALASAMKKAGNVVIAGQLGGADASNFIVGESQYTPPISIFARNAAGVGVANVPVDQDNEIRAAQLMQFGPGGSTLNGKQYPALPVMLASIALHKPVADVVKGLPNTMLINYVGPQNPGDASQQSLPVYQLESVARGQDSPAIFRNKIVLIVPAALVTKDILNTPFGPMYGGFVQANALNTILQRNPIVPVGDAINSLIVVLLGFLTAFLAARFGILRSTGATLVLALGFAALGYVLIDVFRVWVHVVTLEIAIVLTFSAVMALRFSTEERQRRRTAKLFGQYVKPEIVDILVNSPDEVAALAGTRRDISILFVDIRGFTAMSERMEPEDVVAALDVYLELLTGAVLKYDGTINKYIGDEIVAVWNIPHHHNDHEMRAVKSALDMIAHTDDMNAKLREKGLPAIKYGIGVNSGEAIVGQMGSSFRKQYDVIGDTVNTGARLCSAAGGGEVIIGQSTWEAIGNRLVVEETEPLRLKGKSQALRTFLVLDIQEMREPILEASGATA